MILKMKNIMKLIKDDFYDKFFDPNKSPLFETLKDNNKPKYMKEDKWLQGYLCAVCTLIQMNEVIDSSTKELFQLGVGNRTIEDLENLGIDEFDLDIIKKYYNELK